jgi:hypothetical protein
LEYLFPRKKPPPRKCPPPPSPNWPRLRYRPRYWPLGGLQPLSLVKALSAVTSSCDTQLALMAGLCWATRPPAVVADGFRDLVKEILPAAALTALASAAYPAVVMWTGSIIARIRIQLLKMSGVWVRIRILTPINFRPTFF